MGQVEKKRTKNKIVVIAASTGGPKVLTEIVSNLPGDLNVPILVVQHMPEHYTMILAKRLNDKSHLLVKEAQDREKIIPGTVYIAKAGKHMKVRKCLDSHIILLTDEAPREGVKPCANFTYESMAESGYDTIYCIVLTGMGSDGTEGIEYLRNHKNIEVWIQQKETCVVYGMPGSIARTEVEHEILSVEEIVSKIKNI